MAVLDKIDSNVTGLRFAEEESYKVLPAAPVWNSLEPNGYNDFGGEVTTVARNPINAGRQNKKGVATDLDASGGFDNDLTQTNMQNMLQGFFFASLRRKNDVGLRRSPMGSGTLGVDEDYLITDIDTTADEITVDSRIAVSAAVVAGGTGYTTGDTVEVTDANATITTKWTVTAAGGVVSAMALLAVGRTHTDLGAAVATVALTGSGNDDLTATVTYGNGLVWIAGDLLFLAGNNDTANDGLKVVESVADNVITVVGNLTTDAAPASTAAMATVGHQFAADDLNVVAGATYPTMTSDAAFDFTTLGLIPGEPLFSGGDTAATQWVTTGNNGFKRVRSISATAITYDKGVAFTSEDLSGGETIQLFYGRVLKNETGTSIKRRTYNLERQLGAPDDSAPADVQAEYIEGQVPNEFTFNIPTAEKIVCNLAFVGADHTTKDGATALKTGTRPTLEESDAFNTSSNIPRIKMAVHSTTDEAPTALFAFLQELNITINNNVTANKAIGVMGAFEATAGTFMVSGELTAYFADVAAVAAVRANEDVTLEMHLAKANTGMSIDLPLLTLGNGRLDVAQDEPITLPLSMDAATGAKLDTNLNHTLLMSFYDYLPTAAES